MSSSTKLGPIGIPKLELPNKLNNNYIILGNLSKWDFLFPPLLQWWHYLIWLAHKNIWCTYSIAYRCTQLQPSLGDGPGLGRPWLRSTCYITFFHNFYLHYFYYESEIRKKWNIKQNLWLLNCLHASFWDSLGRLNFKEKIFSLAWKLKYSETKTEILSLASEPVERLSSLDKTLPCVVFLLGGG